MLLLGVACELTPSPAPPPTEARVGVHRVRFHVPPDGWLHVNHGLEQRFENETAHISFADIGPATPEGFAETLREARRLFDQNQWEDARTLLVATDPRRFFTSQARWESVKGLWGSVTRIRRKQGDGAPGAIDGDVAWKVNGAFHDLLVQVSSLRQPDLMTLSMSALTEFRHDSMRDIASQEAMAISGRPALRIDTWDRLSHRGRASHVFIESEGRLLCLKTESGQIAILAPAFESILSSLEVEPDQGSETGV